jgi:hypothetical protein
MSSTEKQDRLMNNTQPLEAAQGIATHPTSTGPSLQRASIIFVASVGSFIGASLLLASI